MSDRSRYLMIAEKYLGIYPDFSHYEDTVIKKYLITMLGKDEFDKILLEV